jgi:hypothetical protein
MLEAPVDCENLARRPHLARYCARCGASKSRAVQYLYPTGSSVSAYKHWTGRGRLGS